MCILILGGSGMLGHAVLQLFKNDLDVYATIRSDFDKVAQFDIFEKK